MEQKKKSVVGKRALFILFAFVIVISLIFSRFVYIQAEKEVQGHDLQSLIEKRWSQTKVLEGKRGTIYDKNGEVLAEEIPSYTVVAILDERFENRVKDIDETAQKLSEVLDMDVNTLKQYFQNGIEEERVQIELGPKAKYLSYEKRMEIEQLELPGIILREDPKRYYPKQTFASHVIGYTERDMSNARLGLENSLNEYLTPEDGKITYQKDGANRKLWNADEIIDPPKNGDDVYLTIDTKIQMVIEQTMNQVEELYEPERIMTIVANAKTGEILGMSNRPTFNPNEYEHIENYTNYNISSRFEPGSTMKIFSLAAAIDAGVYNGDEKYKSGSYPVDGFVIRDHNYSGWGEITFDEGFQRSSNVAFSILALDKLGPQLLYQYLEEFGFGKPTGIDLPNEASGMILKGSKSEAATTAFGQGTVVTPIQQVQAATAIANGGKMMKPYVIDRIVSGSDNKEVVLQNEPEVVGEPISEETAKEVRSLMESVITSDVGTGKRYAIDGYSIGGKTGTAQIPREDGPGYLTGHGNYLYSFIGMAPIEDPEVIVYVAVDRPKLNVDEQGSIPVSMIFKPVMKQSLQYLNIQPTKSEDSSTEKELPNLVNMSVDEAVETIEQLGFDPVVLGEASTIVEQYPTEGDKLIIGEKVFLKTDGKKFSMPNITGWSMRQVYILEELLDIQIILEGTGFVVKQTPEPGTDLSNVTHIIAQLRLSSESDDEVEKSEELHDDGTADDQEEEFFMD